MMERRAAVLAALCVLFVLGAHAVTAKDTKPAKPKTKVVVVSDWTQDGDGYREIWVNGITCIEFRVDGAYYAPGAGGLSCDWEHNRR